MFFIAVFATSIYSWKLEAFLVTSETSTVISPKIRALYIVRKTRIPNMTTISVFVLGPISFPPRASTAVYKTTRY